MGKKRVLEFKSWEDAVAYALEKDEPVVVKIVSPARDPGVYRIFPDGGVIRGLDERSEGSE